MSSGSDAAGVVLAGGRSSRMGTPKAALEWHGSTLLRRTAGILARAAGGPVVVVRSRGQPLPALPPGVEVVDDPRDSRGPVQGLAAGLAAVADRAEAAFVSATDLPFLHPAFVRRVLRVVWDGADVALPVARRHPQPLAAAYRTALAPIAERLVAAGRLRPAFLFEQCAVTRLDEAALLADPVLARLDPALDSLVNVNEPDEYLAARSRPAPQVTVIIRPREAAAPSALPSASPPSASPPSASPPSASPPSASPPSASPAAGLPSPAAAQAAALAPPPAGLASQTVRAATVAEAATAAGLRFGGSLTALLDGSRVTRDGQAPLASGDTVVFLPAAASR